MTEHQYCHSHLSQTHLPQTQKAYLLERVGQFSKQITQIRWKSNSSLTLRDGMFHGFNNSITISIRASGTIKKIET